MNSPISQSSVAVVIPVYNRAAILKETLTYVLAQTLLPDALIVVDDESTDNTAAEVEQWLEQHAAGVHWELIRASKSTVAGARNRGLSRVESVDYVAFLDSDDHWPEDFLERCVNMLDSEPDAVAATTERFYRCSPGVKAQHKGGLEMVSDPITWFFKYGAGVSSCSLLRKSVVQELGAWPEVTLGEDTQFFGALTLKGPWVFAEGAPVTFHIGNGGDTSEEGNLSRKYADREEQWVKDFEAIYAEVLNQQVAVDHGPLKMMLGVRWHRAYKMRLRVGDVVAARACLKHAIRWNPRCWKYRKHALLLSLTKHWVRAK